MYVSPQLKALQQYSQQKQPNEGIMGQDVADALSAVNIQSVRPQALSAMPTTNTNAEVEQLLMGAEGGQGEEGALSGQKAPDMLSALSNLARQDVSATGGSQSALDYFNSLLGKK